MFMFRLALELSCTITELVKRMSYEEFIEWSVFYKHEPWGSEIDDIRNAVVASTVANSGLMMANPKRLKSKPFEVDQFRSHKKPKSIIERIRSTKETLFSLMKGAK